ncbi:MAG: hypothetical protein AB8H79_12945 [Myxococcota bacterium]
MASPAVIEHMGRQVFALAMIGIGLGLGLPGLIELQASRNPVEVSCKALVQDRVPGWVRATDCHLDLAAALYEEDIDRTQVTQAWIPVYADRAALGQQKSPLVVDTADPDTLERLTWGRNAVLAAGDDPVALANVLEAFEQAGARELTGRVAWDLDATQRQHVSTVSSMLAGNAGYWTTAPTPWVPAWGWTLVGVLGIVLALVSAFFWFRSVGLIGEVDDL